MNRRAFLNTSALAAVGLIAARCAGQTPDQLTQDVTLITAGASAVVAALQAVPGLTLPAATVAAVQTAIGQVQANAGQIAASVTSSTVLQDFDQGVSTLNTLLAPYFPEAPAVANLVQAIATLAQTILTEAGVLSAPLSLPAPTMTAAQARTALRQATGR